MSRHHRPEPDTDPEPDVLDAPTGPLALPSAPTLTPPPRTRVVVVPRPRPASEPVTAEPRRSTAETALAAPQRSVPVAAADTHTGLPAATTWTPHEPAHPWPGVPDDGLPAWPWPDARTPWPPAPPSVSPTPYPGSLPSSSWPAPPPRRGASGLVVGAVALLVVLLVGLGVGLVRPELLGLSSGTPSLAEGEPAPGTDVGTTEVAPASGDTTAAPTTDPTTELHRLARSDDAALDAVTGAWVPQLSSKRPGLVDGGRTWDAAAILAEHEALRARYPQARLLWSGDWPVFTGGDYWVTVLASPSSSAATANGWCDRQGLGADDCFAKRLARSGGSEGTAVHR
ncbi:hypothetical protein ACQPX6_21480 [Actinomycetospora sp. CA-101289]|uniref:hypothetical protein n=1 Tax=Actinomycetospora sp. CA-101289 TaxID=3239893 RepID=UPI003D99BCE0